MDNPERALWLAVLAQAFEDIRDEPRASVEFDSAAAFLTDIGTHWRRAREGIADMAEVSPEHVRREALTVVTKRRQHRVAGEQQTVVVLTPSAPARPTPSLDHRATAVAFTKRRRLEGTENPFSPFRRRA